MPVAYTYKNVASPKSEPKYWLETYRLKTFEGTWIHADNSLCSKDNMAKAGFYFAGSNDLVKCFVCQMKLEDWDPDTDEPWLKHLEISPKCIFARIGQEQASLTVEQWIEVMCARGINTVDHKFYSIQELADQI